MRIHLHAGRPVFVTLPDGDNSIKAPASPPTEAIRELRDALEGYFKGREVSSRYAEALIASISTTPFESAVLKEVARIPRGEVRSYGEIAELAGYPRAARAVGNVMHNNPFPIIIPCHRVIRGDGSIGGYGGAEGIKSWLLDFEGGDPETR
ncbi:MAG: MGMT family protein [Actinobacteria bacterium]|nr:MGMT family protein [Actinomycetota bacterium]